MKAMQAQLDALLDEKEIRQSMLCYMSLCDDLGPNSDLKQLMALFSVDAIWEGKGARYTKSFGRFEGHQEINDMFAKYTKLPGHFKMNLHFLGNENITVDGERGRGQWMLLQPSDFNDGRSQLSCARITASFIKREGQWLIHHFQTENIFSRPMGASWDQANALPVPE